MKKLVKKLEDLMVAITFVEAGEFDEASRVAGNPAEKDESTGAAPEVGKATEMVG